MSNINFDNPYLLLLAVPLVILFAVPFFIAVRKDNVNGHNIASSVLHVLMALLIAFAAAGTSVVTTVTETDVYVLADVSYSTQRNYDLIDEYIDRLGDSLPNNSRMGVIAFGKDYQLLSRLGERPKSVSQATAVDTSGTDIVGALDFTGSLFRDGVLKHIVVITDGKQSDESDSGALKRQVDALAENEIHVSAIYIDDNLPADVREIQLSSVNISDNAYLNREQEVTVTIKCNGPDEEVDGVVTVPYSAEAILVMKREGAEVARRTVYLTNGENYETFSLSTSEAGTFACSFELQWTPDYDTNRENNKINFKQQVSGDVSVLLVSTNRSDYALMRQMFGPDAEIDDYTNVPNVPYTVEELCKYDEIVLSDVDVLTLTNKDMFLESVDTAVSMFGKSLITLGDTSIQDTQTDQTAQAGSRSALSDMLPVVFGANEGAGKHFVIVMDTSRSMFDGGKFQRAKTAAKMIVNQLTDTDYVSVVEFNGNAYKSYSAVSSLEYSRDRVLALIDGFDVEQGTNIGSGLRAAGEILVGSTDVSEKQIMLITDGTNFMSSGTADSPEKIAADLNDEGITTSVLDVGGGGTNAPALIAAIVKNGGGKMMDISADDKLENVSVSEFDPEGNFVGGPSDVTVERRADELLEGISADSFAPGSSNYVSSYYVSEAKPSATTVLSLAKGPLYAYWYYGNGKVSCFTTSVVSNGTTPQGATPPLATWDAELKATLFGNLFESNIPEEKIDYPFVLDVVTLDGYTHVTLTPATVDLDATAEISVSMPDGSVRSSSMVFGSKTYDYEFVSADVGDYDITIKYSYGTDDEVSVTRHVSTSYEPEYDSFALFDAAVLHKMVGSNGTVSEDGNLEIENAEGEAGLYDLPLALPLLIAAVALFAVDIGVRKLKWDDIKGIFKRVNG